MLDTQQYFHEQVTRLPKKAVTVIIFTLVLLFMSGYTELNPGPNKTNSSCKFYVCLLNLNNLAALNLVGHDII